MTFNHKLFNALHPETDEKKLTRELRFARKTIRQMRRETNQFDHGRAVANKALKRLDAFIKSLD